MADDEIPPEVHHYSSLNEVPWDIQKYAPFSRLLSATHADQNSYWAQRYKIFTRYDEGVWLTDDAWFGVTPEPVAKCVCVLCGSAVNVD